MLLQLINVISRKEGLFYREIPENAKPPTKAEIKDQKNFQNAQRTSRQWRDVLLDFNIN